MKKLLLSSIVLMLALATVACAKPAPAPSTSVPTAAPKSAATSAPTPAPAAKTSTSVPTAAPKSAATSAPTPAPAAKVHEWKFPIIVGSGEIYYTWYQNLAERIKQTTDGQVRMTVYPVGELPYKATDYLKTTKDGLTDAAEILGGYVFGDAPLMAILDLPMLALTPEENVKYRDIALPYVYDEMRKWNVEPLTYLYYAPRQILANKPMKTVADLKGLKLRSSGLQPQYLSTWGVVPVSMTPAEVYTALQRGVIDGVTGGISWFQQGKIYEVANSYFEYNGEVMYIYPGVNKTKWDGLGPALQAKVKKAAEDWQPTFMKPLLDMETTSLKWLVDNKKITSQGKLADDVRADTRKKMIPVLKNYVKDKMGSQGTQVLNKVLAGLGLE